MLKLDLIDENERVSYAVDSDRMIVGERKEHAFRWTPVRRDIVIVGATQHTLDTFLRELHLNWYPVIDEAHQLYVAEKRIVSIETLARVRYA